ncbi:MAG TPA: ABC transporter ATP-binding protein [Thermodesulfovibrionales bacterium]|nr:ABC transporter ATP-binding protein [Thermodesulfovibrionales bacterium]
MKNLVEAREIEKSFYTPAGELRILKGVDLSINTGEIVGIVGASGVGKSTFLHVLGALDRPTSGKVFYEDRDIFSMDNGALALFRNRTMGFVFQFHHLLPEFTALENVMMPGLISFRDRAELKAHAEGLLNELGVYERKDHRPGELSGGEQQRVAVARSLILNPRVVLADEPTGNLDTTTGEELFYLLLRLNQERNITFVIVTHNESLSKRCHRVLTMVDGRLEHHH